MSMSLALSFYSNFVVVMKKNQVIEQSIESFQVSNPEYNGEKGNMIAYNENYEDNNTENGSANFAKNMRESTDIANIASNEKESTDIAKQIAKKWDNANENFSAGGAWHQHPLVVKTVKERLASGSPSLVHHIREKYGVRSKCLSIGCGDGGIEVEMVQAGLCETMEGIDLSPVRIDRANQKVPAELRSKVHFSVKNAEKDLEGQEYDLVLFTHALHHIFDLETMSMTIRDRVMNPTNGILVLEEYVGAVRYQFPQSQLDAMATFLKSIEGRFPDRVEHVRQNPLWNGKTFFPPDSNSIEKDDPSETIRSNEIVPVLSQYFTIVEDVPLGGNFFQWIFHNVYNSLRDETGLEIVQTMLDAEMQAIADGKVTSDYVFQVWKNKHEDNNKEHYIA